MNEVIVVPLVQLLDDNSISVQVCLFLPGDDFSYIEECNLFIFLVLFFIFR